MNVDEALKLSPLPLECECPECGGHMELCEDIGGSFYKCTGTNGEFDCGIVEVHANEDVKPVPEPPKQKAPTTDTVVMLQQRLDVLQSVLTFDFLDHVYYVHPAPGVVEPIVIVTEGFTSLVDVWNYLREH